MTIYSVKLVDHRSSTDKETVAVLAAVKKIMDQAFDGTSDSLTYAWGAGEAKDTYVIHFVEDIANSVLVKEWPSTKISPKAGGHTHTHGKKSGTELYRISDGSKVRLSAYGYLAFHEALHNLLQDEVDVHNDMGGGLASATVPHQDPNDDNKSWLRKGFAKGTKQLL